MSSTEEDILGTMPELDDAEIPYGDDDTQDEGSLGPASDTTQETSADSGGTDNAGEQEQQGHVDGPASSDTWFGTDARGNFIDNKGNVAIAAGQARRVFEQVRRENKQYADQLRESQRLYAELERKAQDQRVDPTVLNGLPAQYGMSAEEVSNAIRYWQGIKTTPAETVGELVKIAREQGHNIDGIGAATDVAAIKAVMNEVMAPVLKTQQQADEQVQARAKANEYVQTFFGEYGDAKIHEQELAALIQAQPGLSLHKAYTELKTYAIRNGLDWSQSLVGQQPRTNGGGVPKTADPSLVSGQSVGSAGGTALQDKEAATEFADPDKSWREILEMTMPRDGRLSNFN